MTTANGTSSGQKQKVVIVGSGTFLSDTLDVVSLAGQTVDADAWIRNIWYLNSDIYAEGWELRCDRA